MKPYESYKSTKITWYPEIPEKWDYCKVKHIANTYAGGTPSTIEESFWENGNIPWLPSGKLQNCEITTAEKFITEEGLNNSSSKWIKPNTVLVALTGATCANIGFLTFQACANQSVVAIDENPNKANSRFLYYMFLSMRSQILTHQTGGAQAGINDGDVKNLYLLKPSPKEQTQIAAFLDYKTNLIDATIEKKKRLIELLKEKRKAVINEAVTKGLNPNALMKDSGVEWLGEIPENWEVKKIKNLISKEPYSLKTGPFGSQLKSTETLENGPYVVYNQRNVLDNQFNEFKDFIDEQKKISLSGFEVFENDILITTRGTIGKASIVPKGSPQGVLHPCLIKIKLDNKKILNNWLLMYINNTSYFIENVILESNSTTIEVIYGGTLREILIPIPNSLIEQNKILDFANDKLNKINISIEKIEIAIERLQDYRQSIISEAVTGKIDLRDWQPNKEIIKQIG